MMQISVYSVEVLETDDGKIPFDDWIRSLKDRKAIGLWEDYENSTV